MYISTAAKYKDTPFEPIEAEFSGRPPTEISEKEERSAGGYFVKTEYLMKQSIIRTQQAEEQLSLKPCGTRRRSHGQ